jgi:hypothetical protein
MLKKTTVYLSDKDLVLLRKKATVQHVSVAEVIRLSIQEACQPKTKEEQDLWNSLDRIWTKTGVLEPKAIESAVNRATKEVRGGKTRRHS